jgi:molybdopterin/thiamine biosynthesis adenylyltransferase
MSHRVVLLEAHRAALHAHLFDRPGIEGAAFVLCGEAAVPGQQKLISQAVLPIAPEDFLRRERYGLTITSRALMRATKLARQRNGSLLFAHSHPDGPAHFSAQDDQEERSLLPFLRSRVPGRSHGTLVLTDTQIAARIYTPEQSPADVFVVGERIVLHQAHDAREVPNMFNRQIRAFGEDIQRVLRGLHIGIVGVGGTGSPLAEQLYRLGVGRLSLFDGDTLEETNLNRVYGSTLSDVGTAKVLIAKRHLDAIGLPTIVDAIPRPITEEETARRLRECDVVFGCTDKQIPRAILMMLAIKYSIPVLDMGVLIDSLDQQILGVHGRITSLLPGESCLFCRGRISPEAMRVEALNPEERAGQVQEGYAPELDEPAPSVISFTSAVASFAVTELLHRLTGFMGAERNSSEILIAFDQSRIRKNRVEPREGCQCGDPECWGTGDESPFLGMTWATMPN